MKLEVSTLRQMWPHAPPAKINAISEISEAVFEEYGIDEPTVVAQLMGNVTVENGAGTIIRENGNYSAARLVEIFGSPHSSAAVTPQEATALQHRPQAIFERVYNLPGSPHLAKMLGNHEPGDGCKFRGGGDLQLTGRASYEHIGSLTGHPEIVENPDLIADPKISFTVACAEFAALGCIPWAKKGNTSKVRRLVNGGTNGLAEVEVSVKKWMTALPGIEAPALVPRAADTANTPSVMSSKIMQGAAGTAGSIGVAAVSKVAENANVSTSTISVTDVTDKIQQAHDTITTVSVAKDNITAIVQVAKPFLGLASSTWAVVAIVAICFAAAGIGYTIYQRYAKMRDQGV